MILPIATDVWHVPGAPMRLPGGVRMPLNAVLVRLPDRTLLLYSPNQMDDATAAAIDAEGELAHIVAPNLLHHLFIQRARERWPRASLHAPPGLAAKRPDLKVDHELASTPLADALDVELIGGAPKLSEAVLFHRASGTLVCADFVFNVTAPANLATRMLLSLTGTSGREVKQSRVWGFLGKDRPALRASIERVVAWPIAHLAPVHGEAAALTSAQLAPKLTRAYKGAVPVPA